MTCVRCCLHNSLKISNFITNLLGIAMIIYCLWLEKKWDEGVAQLATVNDLPKPWFIYACLGVGIAICLITIFGYIVGNSISSSTLAVVSFAIDQLSPMNFPFKKIEICSNYIFFLIIEQGYSFLNQDFQYIVSICSLLFLQVAVIVTIFFKFDWSEEIAKYIDERLVEFRTFVIFHLKMCQFIAIMILVPQITVVTLAIILLTLGSESERMTRIRDAVIPDFTRSFLVGSGSGLLDGSIQVCGTCESLRLGGDPQRSWLSYIEAVLSMPFLRTPIDH